MTVQTFKITEGFSHATVDMIFKPYFFIHRSLKLRTVFRHMSVVSKKKELNQNLYSVQTGVPILFIFKMVHNKDIFFE